MRRHRTQGHLGKAGAVVLASLFLGSGAGFAAEAASAAGGTGGNAPGIMAGWLNKWPDGSSSGAEMKSAGNVQTITGTSKKQSYGNVHKRIGVDLDKTPFLTVDVASVNGFWFLIAKSPRIKQGYMRIQPDTNVAGVHIYDVKALTGLSGRQELEVELGVSSGKQDPNYGKSFSIKDFRFVAKSPRMIPGALRLSGWKDKWPDGTPAGAKIEESMDGFKVVGTSKSQGYGTVYRVISVNLDKTPMLAVSPTAANGYWYVEALGGGVKEPVKIQPDTTLTDAQSYDLVSALGLTGEQSFELHIGVSTAGETTSNAGKEVSFKEIAFTGSQQEGAPGQ
ncbi:MAG: hypothetical protein ACT4O3_07540 [Elusimicrobiota bacterium]